MSPPAVGVSASQRITFSRAESGEGEELGEGTVTQGENWSQKQAEMVADFAAKSNGSSQAAEPYTEPYSESIQQWVQL